VKLLLDTHALLWWATSNARLPRKVHTAIGDSTNRIYVSAATAWEIAIKVDLGKLEWPSAAGTVNAYVLDQQFTPLPISLIHAELAGQLRMNHRDPFDRMLIVQAQSEDLLLASNEERFDSAGVRRYW
jgi:PIN domain nuclease of toxin-antitoxin system